MSITIDLDSELPEYSPVCTYCRHEQGFRRCAAFREREIPLPIWLGENPHLEAFPGDNGLQFTPVDSAVARAALESLRKQVGLTTQ